MRALNSYLPEKQRQISSDDQPWITHRLKMLDRKRKRIYSKERKSERWSQANKLFKHESMKA